MAIKKAKTQERTGKYHLPTAVQLNCQPLNTRFLSEEKKSHTVSVSRLNGGGYICPFSVLLSKKRIVPSSTAVLFSDKSVSMKSSPAPT